MLPKAPAIMRAGDHLNICLLIYPLSIIYTWFYYIMRLEKYSSQKNLIRRWDLNEWLVRLERFELSRINPLPPEDSASASSATTAYKLKYKKQTWNGAAGETWTHTIKDHYPLKVARLPFRHSRIFGASARNRTVDTRIFSPLLYQLSYRGKIVATRIRFELTISAVTGRHVRPLHHRAASYLISISITPCFVNNLSASYRHWFLSE